MENKSLWIFEYANEHSKENNQNKLLKDTKNLDSNSPEKSVAYSNKKIISKPSSKIQEPLTFTIKETKPIRDSSYSPASSIFNKNRISSLPRNSNVQKSVNFRNFPYKDGYNEENLSLSYRQPFSIKVHKNKNKNRTMMNLKEIKLTNINAFYNYNTSLNLSTRNVIKNNIPIENVQSYKEYNTQQSIDINNTFTDKFVALKNKEPKYKPSSYAENSADLSNIVAQKRVRFSTSDQVIPQGVSSKSHISISHCNINKNKTILKKEDNPNANINTVLKQGYLLDLYDKDRTRKIISQEFQNIFDGLDDLKIFSTYSMENSPLSVIDDLRLMILDFTSTIQSKKNEIENNMRMKCDNKNDKNNTNNIHRI